MTDDLEQLKKQALDDLAGIGAATDLETWRVNYLGKKSRLNAVLRSLGQLPPEERKATGGAANKLRAALEASLNEKDGALKQARLSAAATKSVLDITLPGSPLPVGRLHPITQTLYKIFDIFTTMGFQFRNGPDAEWDYYNFEALNIPREHPSRDDMSTFWVDTPINKDFGAMLLRTHTTSVTAHTVKEMEPPLRVIEPGLVYRYEATDATHITQFYQIDGFAVGKGITMADLKGTLYEFARRFFGEDRKVRFRADYFPFVEPGVEMAISCGVCGGEGCRLCGDGWIEILGAGMTHPDVLRRGGIDPDEYTSYAFGIGIERLPMLRYGIDDIRLFYNNDLRFLRQF
jgi:phenylalanyl-tRNA synthetase alpha chain